MILNYTEFKRIVWMNKRNLIVSFSKEVDDLGVKFYEIFASEVQGSLHYICKINSIDDSSSVIDFESNYLDLCNKEFLPIGLEQTVQNMMLEQMQSIVAELKLLNERIEFIAQSGINKEDVDSMNI